MLARDDTWGLVALVALDPGILVASHLGIQKHRQVISGASFDSFRFFALEWFQGWFSSKKYHLRWR